MVELGPESIELVAGFVVSHVIGRLRQMLEIAAGLPGNSTKRGENFPHLPCPVRRLRAVQSGNVNQFTAIHPRNAAIDL